jgi:hypothetical protein
MGSPLTLSIANFDMYFFEQSITKQVKTSQGLYLRYIVVASTIIDWSRQNLIE